MRSSFALPVLVAASVLAIGCKDNQRCAGIATCFGAQPSQCQSVPGCSATAGCMLNPGTGDDCMTAVTQGECDMRIAFASCAWSNGVCTGTCDLIVDEAACTNSPAGCIWSACTGTPPKPCSQYTADSCPHSPLGCYVEPIE